MKTIFKSLLYFSFAGLLLTGCAKNDDFSVPNVDYNCEEPNLHVNKTIGELQGIVTETLTDYTEDDVVSGYVISSDRGGNFYREIYIVDEANTFSALVRADIKGSYARYPLGSKIYIKLQGTKIQRNNGMFVIGDKDTRPGKDRYISYMGDPAYKKHVIKGCARITDEDLAKKYTTTVTLKEATETDKYLGKLITITDVQFKEQFRGKTFYDPTNITNSATENEIESKDPVSAKVIFRAVEQSSAFANEKVPNGSGTMTGVMTKFQSTYQFIPRFWEDLKLDQPVFGDSETPVEPGTVEPGKFLAFPGADFENWDTFLSTLEAYNNVKIKDYATQAVGQGWDNKNGLSLKGSPKGNDYVFTTEKVINVPTGATKLSFLVKGTSGKSLVPLIYKADGKSYYSYNVGDLSTNKTVTADAKPQDNDPNSTTPSYGGKIDTKGQWVKVTLDLTTAKDGYNTTGLGKFFALKVGKDVDYDLVIDEIRFEDGTPNDGGTDPGTDPEPTEGGIDAKDPNFAANFNNWDVFLKTLNKYGLLKDITSKSNEGKTGAALQIKGKHTKNDYVFTTENQTVKTGATKIVMYVKGTAKKSLSFNVFKGQVDDKGNNLYDAFNIRTDEEINGKKVVNLTEDIIIKKTARMQSGANSGNGNNDYTNTTIDTNGKWIKITLDISDVDYNKSGKGSSFALKIGSAADYDLLIDSISFE